ncbi:MAG: PilZ domain-containing protein [Candidatus Omnitrophica bacterium]|nr:PilZ domain-containing protein [Candidatus Omnitrophota bacterium]
MSEIEKRRFRRLTTSIKIEYKLFDDKTAPFLVTSTKDISGGGLCLRVFDQFEAGSILLFKFILPGLPRFIFTKGRIVWIKELSRLGKGKVFELGVEFIEIKEEDKKRIEEYVRLNKNNTKKT